MTKKVYEQEFKDQLVKEELEVGNASLVARKYGIGQKTLNNWMRKAKGASSKRALRNSDAIIQEIYHDPADILEAIKQNEKLKVLLGER